MARSASCRRRRGREMLTMLGRSRGKRSSIFDILGKCCLCSPVDCSVLGSYSFSFVLCKITCILQVSVIYIFSLLSAKPEMKMATIVSSDERVLLATEERILDRIVTLTFLAAQTKRVLLGTGIIILVLAT